MEVTFPKNGSFTIRLEIQEPAKWSASKTTKGFRNTKVLRVRLEEARKIGKWVDFV